MEEKRRNRTRTDYAAHALVKSATKGSIKAVVRDISMESIYLYCKQTLRPDETVRLEIVLLGKDSELIIKVPGKVERRDEGGIAVKFFKPLEWWPVFIYFHTKQLEETAMSVFNLQHNR